MDWPKCQQGKTPNKSIAKYLEMCYSILIMRYILGVLAVVIILFAVIFWAVKGGNDNKSPLKQEIVLSDYAGTDATAIYHVSGEIQAKEEHREIRISVNRNERVFEVISGYDGKVIARKTFPNSSDAFEEFMYALERAGFTDDRNSEFDTVKGVCPKGTRSEYVLSKQGAELSRLWSTSCSRKDGSFAGERRLVRDLFQNQILNYRDLTRDVSL